MVFPFDEHQRPIKLPNDHAALTAIADVVVQLMQR